LISLLAFTKESKAPLENEASFLNFPWGLLFKRGTARILARKYQNYQQQPKGFTQAVPGAA
jgi:hypothetical protein